MDDVQYRNYSLSDGFGLRMNGKEWEYHSLTELNAEWEDYEQPKEHYFISNCGEVKPEKGHSLHRDQKIKIGNDFETKEDAEKTVERLRAWKRLKDKGFKFKRFREGVMGHEVNIYAYFTNLRKDEIDDAFDKNKADLDLLFGGEE